MKMILMVSSVEIIFLLLSELEKSSWWGYKGRSFKKILNLRIWNLYKETRNHTKMKQEKLELFKAFLSPG